MRFVQKGTGKAVRLTGYVLIMVAMSCALLLIAQKMFNPFHVVKGNSMSPRIQSGDAVIVKDVNEDKIKVGQVVVFPDPETNEQYIVHRVTAIENAGKVTLLTTKGDNNPVADPIKIASGLVAGSVAARLPHLGEFLSVVTSPRGYFGLIAIPAALALLLAFGQSIVENVDNRRRRRNDSTGPAFTGPVGPWMEAAGPHARTPERIYPTPTAMVETVVEAPVSPAGMGDFFYPVPTAMP